MTIVVDNQRIGRIHLNVKPCFNKPTRRRFRNDASPKDDEVVKLAGPQR
jgi:hypothetical protein